MNSKFLFSVLSMLMISLFIFSCSDKEDLPKPSSDTTENIQLQKSNQSITVVNAKGELETIVPETIPVVEALDWNNDPCDCNSIYDQWIGARNHCLLFGGAYCDRADLLWSQYNTCTQTRPCPPNFTYDGANCSSGVHFPEGYQGFIWGNAFYTKQNCEISSDNECCPEGFKFDGANCYSGFHYPEGAEPFIFNNAFYIKPTCGE